MKPKINLNFAKVAFVTLCLIAISAFAKATDIEVIINITDNCTGTYSGYYCATIEIRTAGGELLCKHTACNLQKDTDNHVEWQCDLSEQAHGCDYIVNISACRYTDPLSCPGSYVLNPACWADFTSGTSTVHHIYL